MERETERKGRGKVWEWEREGWDIEGDGRILSNSAVNRTILGTTKYTIHVPGVTVPLYTIHIPGVTVPLYTIHTYTRSDCATIHYTCMYQE